jgi:hypothetical protein
MSVVVLTGAFSPCAQFTSSYNEIKITGLVAVELNVSVTRLVFDGTLYSSGRRLLQEKSYRAFKLTVIDEQGQPAPSSTVVTDDIIKVFGRSTNSM